MQTEHAPAQIVDDGRRDRLGRVSWPAARREQLLDEYERSGLSQAAFARRAGVKYPTLAHWVQERRRAAEPAKPADTAPRFVELDVRMAAAPPDGTLRVILPDGVIVSGSDPRAVAGLVKLLWSNTP
jgi:transposase-like protein